MITKGQRIAIPVLTFVAKGATAYRDTEYTVEKVRKDGSFVLVGPTGNRSRFTDASLAKLREDAAADRVRFPDRY